MLDKLDKKIIYELDKDSSTRSTVLAKRLGRSKEVIAYRIKRLQDKGILLATSAIVDMSSLGYLTFRVYIRWKDAQKKEREEFTERLGRIDSIWTIATLHGKWDLAFFIGVHRDEFVHTFHEVWADIQAEYKHKIDESRIAIYSPIFNFNKTFFTEEKKQIIERVYGGGHEPEIDEIDKAIIQEYAPNVRVPFSKVAKKLGLSAETVRIRVRKLEQNKVITGYKIDLDLSKMGYQGYRVDFHLNSTKENKRLFEYLKQHRYFYQINRSIGGADFETEIVVRDLQHLLKVLDQVMEEFPDTISGYEYMGYSLFPKLVFVPD